jgi:hypothetical protein
MATATILHDYKPYYVIEVVFDGLTFVQEIVSALTGAALDVMLQAYADDYMTQYEAL